jgi:hypothetical protein
MTTRGLAIHRDKSPFKAPFLVKPKSNANGAPCRSRRRIAAAISGKAQDKRMRRIAFVVILAGIALGALAPAAAEEQSWSKRTPPPVKFAPPTDEAKPQDWSGFHAGVNGGASFTTKSRESAVPDSFSLSK